VTFGRCAAVDARWRTAPSPSSTGGPANQAGAGRATGTRIVSSTCRSVCQLHDGSVDVDVHRPNPGQVRGEVETQIRQALAEWGVVAVATTLSEFRTRRHPTGRVRRLVQQKRDEQLVLGHERQLLQLQIDNAHLITSANSPCCRPTWPAPRCPQAKMSCWGRTRLPPNLFCSGCPR